MLSGHGAHVMPRTVGGLHAGLANACARAIIVLTASAMLWACEDGAYEKRDGQWHFDGHLIEVKHPRRFTPLGKAHDATSVFAKDPEVAYFRGTVIEGSDGSTFTPLDAHYARDKARVYFCDTFRKGQEYYLTKYNRVAVLDGVSLGSFRLLTHGYARDTTRLYYEGIHVPVADLESFELLEDSFQRDRIRGYYMRRPIAGSDGSTFRVMDAGYSRDTSSVFFAHYRAEDPELLNTTVRVKGASPAEFVVKGGGYAVDSKRVYHSGTPISSDAASFQMLASAYAKTSAAVFYDGKLIPGADAASFVVLESAMEGVDAKDARRQYRRGERVRP